jgi:lauroyl/myristoyl acyltransferase
VVCSLERTGAGLTITATRVQIRASDAFDPALELTRVINDELSRRIRTAPELWPWMHPRWDAHPAR